MCVKNGESALDNARRSGYKKTTNLLAEAKYPIQFARDNYCEPLAALINKKGIYLFLVKTILSNLLQDSSDSVSNVEDMIFVYAFNNKKCNDT